METGRDRENGIQRKPLKEEILEILHDRVIAGKYPPGEWLRQEEIASQLGVSMTPVREALDLLVSSGLAERVPYRGVRIIQPTADEIIDAYGLRLLLEPTAARLAAERADAKQVDSLRHILQRMQPLATLSDMSNQQQLNRKFHQSIITASNNALLDKIYPLVLNAFPDWLLYEAMFRHPELLGSSLKTEFQEHKDILTAIENHELDLAAQYSAVHIINRSREIETFLGIPSDLLEQTEKRFTHHLPAHHEHQIKY